VAPSTLRLDEVTPRRLLSLAPIECRIEVLPEGADQWRKFQLNRDTATIAASLLLSCGRTFPSAAGFQTSEVFFTDDSGSYLFESRDAAVPVERDGDLAVELLRLLAAHKKQIRKLSNSDLAARSTRVPGPWKDSPTARKSAQVHDERFKRLIAVQAQYMFDTFGKFPATVPSVYILMYLQGTAGVLRQAVQARCLFADARPASCALARGDPQA